MTTRNYANVAQPTSLTSDVGINDTTLPVVSTAGYPSAPFTIVLERGDPNEEVVLVQNKTGTSFTDCIRGYDGTPKNPHLNTKPVEHVVAAIDYREANAHVNNVDPNPHPQYVLGSSLAGGIGGLDLGVPIGSLVPYLGTTSPNAKWLVPNGAPVSRTTYSALFALVGTSFGAGDGLSTFNLPDLRGRVLMALDNLGGAQANVVNSPDARVLGGVLGSHTSVLTASQIPAHNHASGTLAASSSGSAHVHGGSTGTSGAHRHPLQVIGSNPAFTAGATYLLTPGGFGIDAMSITGDHTHALSINSSGSDHSHVVSGATASTGGGTSVTMLQPTMAVGYLVRALA